MVKLLNIESLISKKKSSLNQFQIYRLRRKTPGQYSSRANIACHLMQIVDQIRRAQRTHQDKAQPRRYVEYASDDIDLICGFDSGSKVGVDTPSESRPLT